MSEDCRKSFANEYASPVAIGQSQLSYTVATTG